jgi:hypothetical protein
MPICLAVMAACSPIDSPVRGSLFTGISTPSDAGSLPTSLSRSTFDFDRRSPSSACRKSFPNAIGASEVVSTPPAAVTSKRPAVIPSAAAMAACRPVPQAC